MSTTHTTHRQHLLVRVPAALRHELQQFAERTDRSQASVIRLALKQYMAKESKK